MKINLTEDEFKFILGFIDTAIPWDSDDEDGFIREKVYNKLLGVKHDTASPVDGVMKLVEQLQTDIAAIGGCFDGYCIIDPPSGMHTNGGCSCYRDKMKMQRMGLVVRAFLRAITKDKP